MPDPELVTYIRKHQKQFGAEALRAQLLRDGLDEKEIEAALAEAAAPVQRPRGSRARLALLGGAVLLVLAVLLSVKKPSPGGPADATEPERDPAAGEAGDQDDRVFRGHYGYIFQMPVGYETYGTFRDPYKTEELVYIFPKGTDHTHFIHEGLYGNLGILRLEIARRRVPQGFIGIDQLREAVTRKLESEKATFTTRDIQVHAMPAFIVGVEKPFKSVKAYIVGQKVRYTLTGGEESASFSELLSSLLEVSPHDQAGE